MTTEEQFTLHPRLAADTLPLGRLALCELRLMNDRRFPWLILVPRRAEITELHQLTPGEQSQLLEESAALAQWVLTLPGVEKINLAALGNLVPQLHWHVVGRSRHDPCWPGPVWGCSGAQPYSAQEHQALISQLRSALDL